MYDVAIIGAGAAGMAVAIAAKRKTPSLSVAMLDSMPREGKKILATGNGRCNLSNINALEHDFYNNGFAKSALERYNVQYTLNFFKSLGLFTYSDEEGRVYPLSNSSASVADALRYECLRLGVVFIADEKIVSVKIKNSVFVLNGRHTAEKLIIAAGGKASPSQGSDGSGFDILTALGHKVIEPKPALVQLTSSNKIVSSFKGLRAKGDMTLFAGENEIGSVSGEILFTEYGLSGIASMDAQRLLCDYLNTEKCCAVIDFIPCLQEDEIEDVIKEAIVRNPDLKCENLLSGIVAKKFGQGFIKCLYLKNDARLSSLDDTVPQRLAHLIKNFKVYLNGSKGFENAQVTRGGADVNEFNENTMESEIVKNLYCAGEILDVDGGCGGFNLQWAWSSGICAGESCAER